MVSKTVLVAFVALFCAQAFVSAAPYDEEEPMFLGAHHLGGYIKCIKDVASSISIVRDVTGVVGEVKTIINDAKTAKAACTEDKDATEEAVKACKSKATNEEVSNIIAEVTKVGAKFADDLPKIEAIIKECF